MVKGLGVWVGDRKATDFDPIGLVGNTFAKGTLLNIHCLSGHPMGKWCISEIIADGGRIALLVNLDQSFVNGDPAVTLKVFQQKIMKIFFDNALKFLMPLWRRFNTKNELFQLSSLGSWFTLEWFHFLDWWNKCAWQRESCLVFDVWIVF